MICYLSAKMIDHMYSLNDKEFTIYHKKVKDCIMYTDGYEKAKQSLLVECKKREEDNYEANRHKHSKVF